MANASQLVLGRGSHRPVRASTRTAARLQRHRGYWYFGSPPDDTDTVLFVGSNPAYLHQFFTEVSESTIITSGPAMNLFAHRVPVWLCSGRHEPWSQLWPRLRHL